MEIRLLRYFIAVANQQSISAAAQHLHLSQPSLSRQLSEFEKELGTVLFIRGNRKITLTDEGVFLLKKAKEIEEIGEKKKANFNQPAEIVSGKIYKSSGETDAMRMIDKKIIELVEKTEANFNQAEEIVSGKIYIGGGETDAMRLIAKTLKSLLKDYPNIEFHLFSGNADDITDKLDSGVLDFGIVIEPTDKQRYDYIKLPATDVWGVLMRKDSLLADKPFIQPSDLIDKPLLMSRQ